jgi:ribose 5-phosphate isomerase B
MRIAVDCDDAGIDLKKIVVEHLRKAGVEVEDLDLMATKKVDYPDIGFNLAQRVAQGQFDRGVLICGTGLGMAMIANKVPGVFAGVCHDVYSAERLRKSNNAQVITFGSRVVGPELAKTVLTAWLQSEFEPERSARKVARMLELEREQINSKTSSGEKS